MTPTIHPSGQALEGNAATYGVSCTQWSALTLDEKRRLVWPEAYERMQTMDIMVRDVDQTCAMRTRPQFTTHAAVPTGLHPSGQADTTVPETFGKTCAQWMALTHDEKRRLVWPEAYERMQTMDFIVREVDQNCAPHLVPHGKVSTGLHPTVRAAGQLAASDTSRGMSGTTIGILSFLGGLAVGGGAVWFMKRAQARASTTRRIIRVRSRRDAAHEK